MNLLKCFINFHQKLWLVLNDLQAEYERWMNIVFLKCIQAFGSLESIKLAKPNYLSYYLLSFKIVVHWDKIILTRSVPQIMFSAFLNYCFKKQLSLTHVYRFYFLIKSKWLW